MFNERVGSLSTGLIRAAGYANKIRRTAFAQLKDYADPKEIVRATALLNRSLFEVLREYNVEKGDVVRIRISYRVSNRQITWIPESLELEIYKPYDIDVNRVRELLKNSLEESSESEEGSASFEEFPGEEEYESPSE